MKPLITAVATLSYPWLLTAQPPRIDAKTGLPQGAPKFSGVFVFPNEAAIENIKAAAIEVATEKWGATKGPKMVTIGGKGSTFRNDVDDKYPAGSIYISARTETQPGLVYLHADPETGKAAKVPQDKIRDTFYPGAQVYGLVTPFAYAHDVNKGIGWALVGIQKYAEGERLDNFVKAEDAFEAQMAEVPADLKGLL